MVRITDVYLGPYYIFFLYFVNTLDCINMYTRPTTCIINIMALVKLVQISSTSKQYKIKITLKTQDDNTDAFVKSNALRN